VDFRGLFFDEGTFDLSGALAAGEDFAAGQVEGGVFLVAACETVQTFFREGVDDAADAGPVDGSGAHGARVGAGVEGASGELRRCELAADEGASEAFGVLGGVALGRNGVVAGGDENLAILVDDQGAEGMGAVSAGGSGELDCLPEKGEILVGDGVLGHGSFILAR